MFKNSKILKGISLAFALVLVLGCAVMISNYVEASAKTVVFYVSDDGDNTSGSDEATAFTSLSGAIQKANEMKLPTGSRLKLIVVDRITTTTSSPDSTLALDANGYRLPITITSQNTSSPDDYSEIYLAYRHSTASSDYRSATFYNDIYFKDIDIISKVHDVRVGMSPTAKRYSQRNIHFIGYDVTLDNTRIAHERTGSDVETLYVYLDYSTANSTLNYDKVVTIKNYDNNVRGKDSTAAWFFHQYRVPYVGLTVNLENCKFGTIHLLPMNSTATTDDLRKFTLNIGEGAEIDNFYLTRNGHIDIPEGVTINYLEGCRVGSMEWIDYISETNEETGEEKWSTKLNVSGGLAPTTNSGSSTAALHADVTHNVMGGEISKIVAASNGKTIGNVTFNMTGGHVGYYFGAGGHKDYPSNAEVTGTITNNVTGGRIEYFRGGGGEGATVEVPSVINNITGVSMTSYSGGGVKVNAGTVINNLTDVVIGDTSVVPTTCQYRSKVGGTFYGAMTTGNFDKLENNFQNVTLKRPNTDTVAYLTNQNGTAGDVTNHFSGDCLVEPTMYCSLFANSASYKNDLTGTVTNIFDGVTFSRAVYASSRYCGQTGNTVNYINDATFKDNFYGGMQEHRRLSQDVGSITNYVAGGTFEKNFYGGNATPGSNGGPGAVAGNIENYVTGGLIKGSFFAGHSVGDVYGNIYTEFSGATVNGEFIAGNDNGDVHGNVITKISGGEIGSNFVAGNKTSGSVYSDITTTITGGQFKGNVHGTNLAEGATVQKAYLNFETRDANILLLGFIPSLEDLTTKFTPASYTYQIGESTQVFADTIVGDDPLILLQTENWADEHIYFDFAESQTISRVQATNKDDSVSGSAVFDGYQLIGTTDPFADTGAPGLAMMASFHLDETLGITFWVPKKDIEDFIEDSGKWTYSVSFTGKEIAKGEVAGIDAFPADSIKTEGGVEYFTFFAGLGIPASQYDERLLVVLGGVNLKTYTVYDLLEIGISYAQDKNDAKLEKLLKAIHNYGTEANKRFDAVVAEPAYSDVVYTGTDTTTPSVKQYLRGVTFDSNSLSLNDKIAMNFFLKASEQFTVRAFNKATGDELSASKIVLKEINDNEDYNYVVTLILDAKEMTEVYDLNVYIGGELASTATNSVSYSCNAYIKNGNSVDVAKAILAYMEAAREYAQ